MTATLSLAFNTLLGVLLPILLVNWDVRRHRGRWRRRPWNAASLGSAAFAFGPAALFVHFLRTRTPLRGLTLGVAHLALVFAILLALDAGLGALE